MPLPGGATDKIGNRYESLWTVYCLTDVLLEKSEAIRLEPPGAEGQGVEFWIQQRTVREYHQVKRQLNEGRWTLYQLRDSGVLEAFLAKLHRSDSKCVFVSMYAADQLLELTDRAKASSSLEEFKKEFLIAEDSRRNFSTLRSYWGDCGEEQVYEYLQRIDIRSLDERSLEEIVQFRLETLVDADSGAVQDSLAQLALNQIHQELNTLDLWRHLTGLGFKRRDWGNDPAVLVAVEQANERYLSTFPVSSIGGRQISRNEVDEILGAMEHDAGARVFLLTGESEAGKSGAIIQLLSSLREKAVPFLAFRIDRLESTQRPEGLGQQLGLPGSPAAVLDAVATGRKCVLILDQLDSISLLSGRRPELFDCVTALVHQAASRQNMLVVAACRAFDLDNDFRFRNFLKVNDFVQRIEIPRLHGPAVRQIVSGLGLDPARLNPKQIEILQLPLHLSLLAEIAEDLGDDALTFENTSELYDRYWVRKQELIYQRRGAPAQNWLEVLDRLTSFMSTNQTLSAPKMIVDGFDQDVNAIVSENVLVQDTNGRRLAFFHGSFFDYVFARRFIARGDELADLLDREDQGLFRRAQVRQILSYERDVDLDRYLADLRSILGNSAVRFHIKDLVLASLGSLRSPIDAEWEVLAPLLLEHNSLRTRARTAIQGSTYWFQLLDQLGVVGQWLVETDDEVVDYAVWLLIGVAEQMPDRVAELVHPHIGSSDRWVRRLNHLALRKLPAQSRPFLELVLELIEKGILDQTLATGSGLWDSVHSLAEENPESACQVIGHYFERRYALAVASGTNDPFAQDGAVIHSQVAKSVLMACVKGAPLAFIEAVLPFVVQVAGLNVTEKSQLPATDSVWSLRYPGEDFQMSSVLLVALEEALKLLAQEDPTALERAVEPLLDSNLDTIQFLLVRAFSKNPAHFADMAMDYLCRQEFRLRSGYVLDPYWATGELIAAITSICAESRLLLIEGLILDHGRAGDEVEENGEFYDRAQFTLLSRIPLERRADNVVQRLQELEQKFGEHSSMPPSGSFGGFVGSPVVESEFSSMSDDNWLSAFATYATDDVRVMKSGEIIGGATQLAQLMERRVGEEPERFARLALRMPNDVNPVYFDALLRGLLPSSDSVSLDVLVALCERCHDLPNRPCGRALVDLLGKLADTPLPDRALEMVGWYMTEDPDPSEELWRKQTSSGDVYYGGSIESAGLNSVRGGAAGAIARLLVGTPNRIEYFRPILDRMVEDHSVAVRSQVARVLTAVYFHDREVALSLFERLCDAEDSLLGVRSVEQFLRYSLTPDYAALAPVLDRMLRASDDNVVRVGARQACLVALDHEEALPFSDRCLTGSTPMRLGAAEIYAANLSQAGLRYVCESALSSLFYDEDVEVRSAAAGWLEHIESDTLGDFQDSIGAFIDSPAFVDAYPILFDALERTTASVHPSICHASERFLALAGSRVADFQTREAGESVAVSKIVIRAYESAGDSTIRARCLDLIDHLTDLDAWGLDWAMSEYER